MRKVTRHSSWLAFVGLGLGLVFAGCAAKNNGTLMVVNVESDLVVPTEIDAIRLDIVPDHGASRSQSLPLATAAGAGVYVLPVSVALIPNGAPQLGFTVTATALLAGQEVAHQTLTATFVPDQEEQFDLFISRACLGNQALCPDGAASVRTYGGPSDGGTGGSAGSDARMDAGSDGGGADHVGDAGNGDAGPPPPAWMPSTGIAATTTLNSVWARPKDVWAVGNSKATGQIWHFDGSAWTMSTVLAGTAVLYGVWASGPNDAWAVGQFGTILHLTATDASASAVWITAASGFTGTLSGVWGSGASDVWAVGAGGAILHWDGAAWTSVKSPTTQDLLSVTGDAGTDRWAVGLGGVIVQGAGSTATAWTNTASPTQNVLYGVWANTATDVWTVGADGAFHFDGTKWSASPGVSNPNAVWSSGASDVWASCTSGVVAHFNGSAWSSSNIGTSEDLLGLSGTAPRDVWTVGTKGVALNYR